MSISFHAFHLCCVSLGAYAKTEPYLERKRERWRVNEKQFTDYEAGEDQAAVFGTWVSAQRVPKALFSNQRLNGWPAWVTAGSPVLK